jgi:CelD/BcsL family acetyltransferase involved in cellulose biosynthesis
MTASVSTEPAPNFAPDGTASMIASARRAATSDRHVATAFDVEWRPLAELAAIADEWRMLAARAVEPNVFYEPAFALAAAPAFGADVGAVLVWSGTAPRQLLGLFPARIERRRYGVRLPVLVGWTHPYAPLGTPLVERETAGAVITAWLEYVARDPALPHIVLLPFVPQDGPFAAALDTILTRAAMPAADFNRHRRALLAPVGDRAHYIDRALGARRLKELRRMGRRLGDLGAVLFTATDDDVIPGAKSLEDFFTLEASGWKGAAGTAAAHHDDIRRFIETAVAELAAESKAQINRIMLDGRAIAATITLRSGDQAWFWKIAYDESYARFSPGVMLTVAVTEQLLQNIHVVRADSCATANHPMIDHIWRERLALQDRLIGVHPANSFMRARKLEKLRRAALAAGKKLRALVRRK